MRETAERIFSRIEVHDCWEWTGKISNMGYGVSFVGQRSLGTYKDVLIHRFVYGHLVGPIPPGLVLDHLCKNRKCCNPDHLEPVTQRENLYRSRHANVNARKTHCPAGHSYAEHGNRRTNGQRECLVCKPIHQYTYWHGPNRKKRKAA